MNKDSSLVVAGNDKPDQTYITTIMMMCCLIKAFPFDLLPFSPSILTSLLKHTQVSYFKDTIVKVISDFKRTHQDRWQDFKKQFTVEQLDDLQGAGAAHYFS